MKKIFIILSIIILLTACTCMTAFAEDRELIIDNGSLISSDVEEYLKERIALIEEQYDFQVTLASEVVASHEEFVEYSDEFILDYNTGSGTVFMLADIGETVSYYPYFYGEHNDAVTESVLAEISNLISYATSYDEVYEEFIKIVQEILINSTGEMFIGNQLEGVGEGGLIDGFDPIVDSADLLTDSEEEALFERIEGIYEDYDYNVTFLTMDEVPSGDELSYYCNWYTDLDPEQNGAVYGINMEPSTRGFANSTRQEAQLIFNSDALYRLDSDMLSYLQAEEFYDAFNLYLDYTIEYIEIYESGEVYKLPKPMTALALYVVAIPLLIAYFIGCGILKVGFMSKMNTAVLQEKADTFMVEDSIRLRESTDTYTHTTESRVYDPPKKSSSGGGGSGGSSSGYGGSRGGSSGRF